MNAINIIVFLFFTFSVFAQEEPKFEGECPSDVPTVDDFNYEQFTGLWYEIKRYPNTIVSEHCAMANYSLRSYDNFNIDYLSRDIDQGKTTKREIVMDKENLTSNEVRYDIYYRCKKDTFQHLILDTDYKTYSVVWGCHYNKRSDNNSQRLFIYSRKKELDLRTSEKVKEFLKTHGISYDELEDVEQSYEKCGAVVVPPIDVVPKCFKLDCPVA